SQSFQQDPRLVAAGVPAVSPDWYRHSGYDRGHLAPSADFAWDRKANESTFVLSNVAPQSRGLNRGAWRILEAKVRSWACHEGKVRVITGPVLDADLESLNGHPVPVPRRFFKIVIDETPPRKAIGFLLLQTDRRSDAYRSRVVTLRELERQTHLAFFAAGN